MSATGLQVFDRTLQITNIWLNEISAEIGPDRKLAWAVLGAVLETLRDRLPVNAAAHLGAELPLLVRGAYYEHFHPERQPTALRSAEQFLEEAEQHLVGQRPVDMKQAVQAVFGVLSRHLAPGACEKVQRSLPEGIRRLWPTAQAEARAPSTEQRPESPA